MAALPICIAAMMLYTWWLYTYLLYMYIYIHIYRRAMLMYVHTYTHSGCAAVYSGYDTILHSRNIYIHIFISAAMHIYNSCACIYIYMCIKQLRLYIYTRIYTAAMLPSTAMPVYIYSNIHGGDAAMYSNYEHSCLLFIYTYQKYMKLLCYIVAIATIYIYIHIYIAAMPGQQLLPTINSRTYGCLSARTWVYTYIYQFVGATAFANGGCSVMYCKYK